MKMTREEAIETLGHVVPFATQNGEKIAEAIDMAIDSLQREIPKNPIVNYVSDSDGARRLNNLWTEDSYLCPVCHSYFGEIFDEGYCSECGQKLIQKRVRVIEP